ncbi:MAG: M24 family metallopeptidase [Planctomycetota bacterium]|jgi:Xaa-Pro aminopeptidase
MFQQEEFRVKHRRITDYLDAAGLDGVVLGRRCNFSWLTCGAHNYVAHACDVGNSYLLADRDGACVIANNIEAERLAAEELADASMPVHSYSYASPAEQTQLLDSLIASRHVAADTPLPGLNAPMLDAAFGRLRWQLTDWEVRRYRELCRDVALAVEATCENVDAGESENDVAGAAASALRHVDAVPWVLLVGGDERLRRFRHPLPTDSTIARTFMIAVCAERGGLIAACSRMVSFGKVPAELVKAHKACATVDAALWSRTQPGTTLGELFAEAVEAYASVGFADQWRLHHQGGSIGYQPRDVKAAPGEPTAAMVNQAFAWNPSITGTKCEDTILCTREQPEPLTTTVDWPTLTVQWKHYQAARPDILVR